MPIDDEYPTHWLGPSMPLHRFEVTIVYKTPKKMKASDKYGYSFDKAEPDIAQLTEDELHKLYEEAKGLHEKLGAEIDKRHWTPKEVK